MTKLNVVLWEDYLWKNFFPITLTHPVFELRSGIFSALERAKAFFPDAKFYALCREEIQPLVEEIGIGTDLGEIDPNLPTLFLNGRAFLNRRTVGNIIKTRTTTVFISQNVPVALISQPGDERWREFFRCVLEESTYTGIMETFEPVEVDAPVFGYLWEIIARNGELIEQDFMTFFHRRGVGYAGGKNVAVYNSEYVYVGAGVSVDAFAVLDAREGPVVVSKGTKVSAGAVICGPAVVGPESMIMPYTRLRGESTIGPVCRIGGEVEASVILGYTNKYHDGFLGHSYVGEWVNFGALTTNSDLKNNYSNIRVEFPWGTADTGFNKVGVFVGDHTKFGIGTLLNSGSVIGVNVNLYGGGVFPKYVPPFVWGSLADGFTHYRIDKAIQTARVVMSRRGRELTPAQESILHRIFGLYTDDRTAFIVKQSRK